MMYTIHMSVAGYYGGPEVPNRTFFLKQTFLFKSLILKTKFYFIKNFLLKTTIESLVRSKQMRTEY